ncbi:MAG: PH domain-containing protein, partial [Candidatus Levybacteria bacterium]|nr:PH domain-containing protein [Candidatus Levybacteria bacterium]
MVQGVRENHIVVSHLNVRQSIFLLLFRLIVLDILAAIVLIFYFSPLFLQQLPSDIKLDLLSQNRFFVLLLLITKVLLTLYVVLQWVNEYYEITPHKIHHKKGIIWRKEMDFEITHLRSIGIQQGILGRLFNYGSLRFFDWRLQKYFHMYLIHNPH